MKRKRRRELQKEGAARFTESQMPSEKSAEARCWPGEEFRYLWLIGIAVIALCTVIIYGQTVRVSPIDYEDPFYLVHSPYVRVSASFSRLAAVWTEPYFANFHPVIRGLDDSRELLHPPLAPFNLHKSRVRRASGFLLTAFSNATPHTFFQPSALIPASRPKKH